MTTSTNKPPLNAEDVPDEWIAMVREMLLRDGLATRGHGNPPTIQVKSLTTNQWHDLMLPGSGFTFTDYGQRNIVLGKLQGIA